MRFSSKGLSISLQPGGNRIRKVRGTSGLIVSLAVSLKSSHQFLVERVVERRGRSVGLEKAPRMLRQVWADAGLSSLEGVRQPSFHALGTVIPHVDLDSPGAVRQLLHHIQVGPRMGVPLGFALLNDSPRDVVESAREP